jgi:Protein of unknown function (DUF1573)
MRKIRQAHSGSRFERIQRPPRHFTTSECLERLENQINAPGNTRLHELNLLNWSRCENELYKVGWLWHDFERTRERMSTMTKHLGLPAAVLVAGTAILAAQQPPTAPAAVPVAPSPAVVPAAGHIQFATPVADFGKAKVGDIVKYNYIFTNTDSREVLEVTAVQPTCGCTTTGDWTRRVEPGKTGTIPIQFNTANYSGPVLKFITVSTSDRSQATMQLQLKGTVWHPIDVSPLYAIITVPPDATNGSASVRITSNLDEPVTVLPPQSLAPQFAAELKTNQPGKDYTLTVSTVGILTPGTISGQITLKTSSPEAPVLSVIAMANVLPALAISPPQIVLPPGPLPTPITNNVSIQNNSTNALMLSEPFFDAKDVGVQIKELVPGRSFVATVSFPAGFEAGAQQVALTVKSSHPQFPLIRVPVVQPPRQHTDLVGSIIGGSTVVFTNVGSTIGVAPVVFTNTPPMPQPARVILPTTTPAGSR